MWFRLPSLHTVLKFKWGQSQFFLLASYNSGLRKYICQGNSLKKLIRIGSLQILYASPYHKYQLPRNRDDINLEWIPEAEVV